MVAQAVPDKRARGVTWALDQCADGGAPIPVQELQRPEAATCTPEATALASVCPDKQVGGFLTEGVHPRNAHQEATVVCPNHTSADKFRHLVGKAHSEEAEAGRIRRRRPSAAFRIW